MLHLSSREDRISTAAGSKTSILCQPLGAIQAKQGVKIIKKRNVLRISYRRVTLSDLNASHVEISCWHGSEREWQSAYKRRQGSYHSSGFVRSLHPSKAS